jgi:hypothetical protein
MGVLTGAIAIIIVNNKPVGLMRDIRINENARRQPVKGLGTILPKEAPVTDWNGTVSCSFYEIDYAESGIERAIRRDVGVGNAESQVAIGISTPNFEDNLVLDEFGVQINLFKKVKDIIDPATGLIIPNKVPYAIVTRCMIEGDNINISEGSVAGRDQSFMFLDPVIRNA